MTPPQTDQRVYLTVPYAEKDDAKALGAKWDREAKSWYAPPAWTSTRCADGYRRCARA